MASPSVLLRLEGITKEFPGTRALSEVTLEVRAGEIVALCGENGAGKSTLMKILSGVWAAGSYSGRIFVEGQERQFTNTHDAHAAGIAMIHQELAVFPELTVAEHLELDRLPGWIRWESLFSRVQKFLDGIGLGLRADQKVGDLSIGGRQLVEIARALYRDARVLVFDEPTSALTETEVVKLYAILERLRSEGRGIVYITHRMDEVFRLADRVVVLRDGQNAGEAPRAARTELEPKIISWMVGRSIQDVYPPRRPTVGEEILRVEGLTLVSPSGKRLVNNLSFRLHAGEILGLGGLLGAGRSEALATIFGVYHPSGPKARGYRASGNVWIQGRRVDIQTPADALTHRVGLVSEDRKGDGLVLGHAIRSNLMLPALAKGGRWFGRVDSKRESSEVARWFQELRVRAVGGEQAVGELSGGNQQKVVLAKWLATDPLVLMLDEPTRGVDVGAKVEIYQWIKKLSDQGLGLIMASSEMPELLGLCHRILVLREGSLSEELGTPNGKPATQENIMRAAAL